MFDMNILRKIIKMHIGNQSFVKLNIMWLDGLIIGYYPPHTHTGAWGSVVVKALCY